MFQIGSVLGENIGPGILHVPPDLKFYFKLWQVQRQILASKCFTNFGFHTRHLPPHKLLGYFQGTYDTNFWYKTLKTSKNQAFHWSIQSC